MTQTSEASFSSSNKYSYRWKLGLSISKNLSITAQDLNNLSCTPRLTIKNHLWQNENAKLIIFKEKNTNFLKVIRSFYVTCTFSSKETDARKEVLQDKPLKFQDFSKVPYQPAYILLAPHKCKSLQGILATHCIW